MQLNQYDREAFVRAVMDDVPKVDYQTRGRKLAVEALDSLQPPEIAAVKAAGLTNWLDSTYIYVPGNLDNFYYKAKYENNVLRDQKPKVWKQLEEISGKLQDQTSKRAALTESLTSAIKACKTLKQAQERLPEFVKYLPAERDTHGTLNLPVVTNLVADLVKEGWPKEKAKAA